MKLEERQCESKFTVNQLTMIKNAAELDQQTGAAHLIKPRIFEDET